MMSRQWLRSIDKSTVRSPCRSPFLWALSAARLVLLRPAVRKEPAFSTRGADPGQAVAEELQAQPGRFR